MKIKDSFVLRQVAGINVIISASASSSFEGMLTVNDTGVFMWNKLVNGADKGQIVSALTKEYDIDSATAEKDTDAFIAKLSSLDIFE